MGILLHTVLPWIVAGAIINFEGNFVRKYFVNFWEYKYFWKSNCSSRSVIEMMRHFDMKRYSRVHYTLLWGAIIRGGATIQGNTVFILFYLGLWDTEPSTVRTPWEIFHYWLRLAHIPYSLIHTICSSIVFNHFSLSQIFYWLYFFTH